MYRSRNLFVAQGRVLIPEFKAGGNYGYLKVTCLEKPWQQKLFLHHNVYFMQYNLTIWSLRNAFTRIKLNVSRMNTPVKYTDCMDEINKCHKIVGLKGGGGHSQEIIKLSSFINTKEDYYQRVT